MSDLLKKFRAVKSLPIFPLPLVLLPNEFLPLHIFEPRYRQMLKDIEAGNRLFGLSYFNPEGSVAERPETGSFGCIAEVREVQQLEDGRSNIFTIGVMRYILESYKETSEPYFVGEISAFEDYESDLEILQPLANDVHGMFQRIAKAAYDLSGAKTALPEIPQADPQTLSFLVAAAFNLPLQQKYEFMVMRSTIERLEKLQEILKKSVQDIEEGAKIHKKARTNGHSKKKIDFDLN